MADIYVCHYESNCIYRTKQGAELMAQKLAFEWLLTKTTLLSGTNFRHVPIEMSVEYMNDILIQFGARRVAYSKFKEVK